MKEKITLFENGKDVQEGDKFIAHVDSVEGHRRVTLERLIDDDYMSHEDFEQMMVDKKESARDAYD